MRPAVLGGTVTLVLVLLLGVVLGSLTEERTTGALLINAGLFAAVLSGGGVAGYVARTRPLVSGTWSAAPAAVLAVVVQFVRLVGDGEPVPWLGLPLVVLLSASLGTLGAYFGWRYSPARRSLYNS